MPSAGTSNSFTSGRAQGQGRRSGRQQQHQQAAQPLRLSSSEVIHQGSISTSPGNFIAAEWPSRGGTGSRRWRSAGWEGGRGVGSFAHGC